MISEAGRALFICSSSPYWTFGTERERDKIPPGSRKWNGFSSVSLVTTVPLGRSPPIISNLGVHIDDKLNFEKHIVMTTAKVHEICNRILSSFKFNDPQTFMKMFNIYAMLCVPMECNIPQLVSLRKVEHFKEFLDTVDADTFANVVGRPHFL